MSETTRALTAPWPRASAAWWMVCLLFLAGIFSVIDRSILNIMVDPLRRDLLISDEQVGLLQGLAFGLFYAFMGMPMGLLSDRVSRKRLVMLGIALWSVATIASGFARNFGELFSARLLVGLGEATLGPSAISLISDLFAPQKRGRPISVFMMGQGLANGIAISVTGLILSATAAGAFAGWPLLHGLAPWRTAFVLCGVTGLIVALLLCTTGEPLRRQASDAAPKARPGAQEARYFWRNRGVLLPLYLGFATSFMVAYGAGAWAPTMLMRGFHATPGLLGAWLGPLTMAFAAIGPLVAGTLLDRSMRSGNSMARFSILAFAPLLAIPSTLAVLAGGVKLAALLVASSSAVFSVIGTVMFATLQAVVPPRMRGAAIALTLILNTLIGAALGPLLIATVTQRVLGDPAKVGWSIALVAVPCLLVSSGLYTLARRGMQRAKAAGSEVAQLLAGQVPG